MRFLIYGPKLLKCIVPDCVKLSVKLVALLWQVNVCKIKDIDYLAFRQTMSK